MDSEAIERFWDKYIEKSKLSNVPPNSIRWYVKRVESFIKAHPSIQLAQHTNDSLET